MPPYFWQSDKWPGYHWDAEKILQPLAQLRKAQGQLLGITANLNFDEGLKASALTVEEEAIQTAAIEGETLDRQGVRSSIARHLGLPEAGLREADRATDGLVQILLDATRNHAKNLGEDRLLGWHSALFPAGRSGFHTITTGAWRTTKMQVVSGPFGKEKVHYEAPPPERIAQDMARFFSWWNESRPALDGIIRAAVAHLYFVSIHPFEDGNGRLARCLSDMALAQDENTGLRFYSLSAQIMLERNEYYTVLERTEMNNGDLSEWLLWFFACLERAIDSAAYIIDAVLSKAAFWKRHTGTLLNERQQKALNKLLDARSNSPKGFEGGLTTRKYMGITHSSRATAWREIEDLLQKGILKPLPGGGRSASYEIIL